MKIVLVALLATLSLNVFAFNDPKVGGTVSVAKDLEKSLNPNGVLFIIAKKAGPDSNPGDHSPPVAVLKIEHPKFPQAFVLTPRNVMMVGTEFTGPLHVIARYSQSGDALDRKGALEGFDAQFPSTEMGNKNLKIVLKALLK